MLAKALEASACGKGSPSETAISRPWRVAARAPSRSPWCLRLGVAQHDESSLMLSEAHQPTGQVNAKIYPGHTSVRTAGKMVERFKSLLVASDPLPVRAPQIISLPDLSAVVERLVPGARPRCRRLSWAASRPDAG